MDTEAGFLPEHLLVRVLSFVNGERDVGVVRCVSKLWGKAILESRSKVTFNAENTGTSLVNVHQLATLFPLAECLKVVARPSQPFDFVQFMLFRPLALPPRLSSLELHKVQVDTQTLDNLLHTQHLRAFKCTQVEFVDVARWKHGPAAVQRLYLSDCQFVTARGVGRGTELKKALGALFNVFRGVHELTLESMELSDGVLGKYLSELHELTSLNLAGSRGFSHRAIARMPKYKIKELVLSACWVLNDDMCRVICEACPGLETLGVYEGQISTTTVNLISSLKHLKTLDMGYSDGDVSPVDLQRMLLKLKGLTVLNLGGVSAVNDFVMDQIGQMKTLKRLDISGCPNLTSDGFKALSKLELLEDLAAGWNSKFGDTEVLECLPISLEILDVSYAPKISDAGLAHLARLVRLKELKLTSCKGVSRDGIEVISQRGVSVEA